MLGRHRLIQTLIVGATMTALFTGCALEPAPSVVEGPAGPPATASPVARPAAATDPTPTTRPQPTAAPVATTGAAAASPVPPADMTAGASLEVQAQADLARRLNAATQAVQIVSVTQREMPAGSLGCGEDKGAQPQGIVMGDEIVLRVGGQEYTYRSDGLQLAPCSPIAFPGGREPLVIQGSNPAEFQAQNLAMNDLAQRLGVAKSAITLVKIEAVEWPDASLGCPRPGMMYAQVITPGYLVVLRASGRNYEYHTSMTRAVACER